MSSSTELRQRGLASLEFVLVLPILIIITFLAMAIVKIGHLRLDMQISARNQVYQDAYGLKTISDDLPGFLGSANDIDAETHWYVGAIQVSHPDVNASAGENFYDASATGSNPFNALRQSLDPNQVKITPTAHASSTMFTAIRSLGPWQIDVREQYAVAAKPIWERRQMPLGYDQYLYDELKTYTVIVPGIPGMGVVQDIITRLPRPVQKFLKLGDIRDYDFDYLYHGVASDAVIDVFPEVQK